jgi:hypothetical protein
VGGNSTQELGLVGIPYVRVDEVSAASPDDDSSAAITLGELGSGGVGHVLPQ